MSSGLCVNDLYYEHIYLHTCGLEVIKFSLKTAEITYTQRASQGRIGAKMESTFAQEMQTNSSASRLRR